MRFSFREGPGEKDAEAFPTKAECASATSGRTRISGPEPVEMCQGGELQQEERSSGGSSPVRRARDRELPRSGFVQLRLCGHGTYAASVAALREIPQDRPDDGHITSCSLDLLRSSENVLTVLDRCAVADAPQANTPDHDRIGQRPPAFPGNR